MSSRVVVLVQSRLGSTRYPGKALAPLADRPLTQHVMERAHAIKGMDWMELCVPQSDGPWPNVGYPAVPSRAPERHVLRRLWLAAKRLDAGVVVRLTGDCPLLAPDLCEQVIDAQAQHDAPYVWNCGQGYVDGTDCEAIRMDVLEHAHVAATSDYDREHVTSWIRRHYPVLTVPPRGDYSQHKWSVDTPDDLWRVSQIMAKTRGLMFADTLAAAAEAGL